LHSGDVSLSRRDRRMRGRTPPLPPIVLSHLDRAGLTAIAWFREAFAIDLLWRLGRHDDGRLGRRIRLLGLPAPRRPGVSTINAARSLACRGRIGSRFGLKPERRPAKPPPLAIYTPGY
jgi:hypothetical protein